jgi:hypothetical protein
LIDELTGLVHRTAIEKAGAIVTNHLTRLGWLNSQKNLAYRRKKKGRSVDHFGKRAMLHRKGVGGRGDLGNSLSRVMS